MRVLSVCSGIGADAVAWHPLGWRTAAFAEIDKQACAVLAHHYPDTPNHGDFTTIEGKEYGPIDLIAGGTPCQAFSVAGRRGGLGDQRGNLALEFCTLVDRILPTWIVWENVPGVLSSDENRALGSFIGQLVKFGYGVCWRVLDAQFTRVQQYPFAVPQRRRRLFLVGYIGDWRPPCAVLLERESLRRDSPPRREARKGIAASLGSGVEKQGGGRGGGAGRGAIPGRDETAGNGDGGQDAGNGGEAARGGSGGPVDGRGRHGTIGVSEVAPCLNSGKSGGGTYSGGNDFETSGGLVAMGVAPTSPAKSKGAIDDFETNGGIVAGTVSAKWAKGTGGPAGDECQNLVAHTLTSRGADASETGDGRGIPLVAFGHTRHGADCAEDVSPTLTSRQGVNSNDAGGGNVAVAVHRLQDPVTADEIALPIDTKDSGAVLALSDVRRLTPLECERLMGLPDGYTAIDWKGKPLSNSARYKLLGNSIAINCLSWIGQRIAFFEEVTGRASSRL